MQIQSEVVAHGLPDAGALMPVDDRRGSAQGIPGTFNGVDFRPLVYNTRETLDAG